MKSNVSAENYLETILVLSNTKPCVRSVDVAEKLGFRKSSVSVAVKRLREQHHILVSPEGYLTLTDSGRQIAEMIYQRHQLIYQTLTMLGVPEDVAYRDACRIEHWLSPESYEALRRHIDESPEHQKPVL